MIIWTGYGFLIALIGLVSLLGMQVIMNSVMSDPSYYANHIWVKMLAMIMAAFFSWMLSIYVSGRKQRTVTDKDSGEITIVTSSHSLFFIEAKYWPFIYLLIAAVLFFYH